MRQYNYFRMTFQLCYFEVNLLLETGKWRLGKGLRSLVRFIFLYKDFQFVAFQMILSHWLKVPSNTEIKFPFHFKPYFYVLETFHASYLRRLLHVEELKLSPGWNFIPGWNFFRLLEHFNPRWKQEYFNPGWNQKHHF